MKKTNSYRLKFKKFLSEMPCLECITRPVCFVKEDCIIVRKKNNKNFYVFSGLFTDFCRKTDSWFKNLPGDIEYDLENKFIKKYFIE